MKEAHFKLLRLIESRPHLTQRELARELGVSLGIEQKAVIAMHFLRRKVVEYEVLEKEIAQLRREVDESPEHKPQ